MNTMTNDAIDQTFSVTTPAELLVNTVSGQVTVRGHDDNTIRVHAVKEGNDAARAATEIDLQQDGNRVSIGTRGGGHGFAGPHMGRGTASVSYDIAVPRNCRVNVRAVSADVLVAGVHNEVQIGTVSGDVQTAELNGSVSVTTVSGDAIARQLRGRLTLHTTSGDARVSDSALDDFNLHSVSGDFSIETPLTHGKYYYARTVSGDLRIAVPNGTGVTLQMRSVSGDVRSDLPNAEIVRSGRRHWQGRINGGGANVEMQSVSGDLWITGGMSAQPVPQRAPSPMAPDQPTPPDMPTPPEPPESPTPAEPAAPVSEAESGANNGASTEAENGANNGASAEAAASILSLLEQGEISVEDALARLHGGAR